MKIQVLIAAVIASFILYGCEDNETAEFNLQMQQNSD